MTERLFSEQVDSEPDLQPFHIAGDEAERVVEGLRYGVPPAGFVRHFTVGRQEELHQLEHDLATGMDSRAILVRANYGSGKSHLLNLVRDLALAQGYATSLVVVSSHQGVRFNRMDQVLSAVCRDIQCGGRSDRGVMSLFRAYAEVDPEQLDEDARSEREELEDDGRWRSQGLLTSPAMWTALRAAVVSESDDTRDLVGDWLTRGNPDNLPRNRLVEDLVTDLHLGDPRDLRTLYHDLKFRRDDYQQVWDGLNDLDTIARLSGFRGLVLLFDEFEDVIQNLNNIRYETTALENLFQFFSGSYNGAAYFAVTPDFVRKCKDRLLMKHQWHFPYSRFDELPHFELSPINVDDFLRLTQQIAFVHGRAYDWEPEQDLDWGRVQAVLLEEWNPGAPERIRTAMKGFVDYLDRALEREG